MRIRNMFFVVAVTAACHRNPEPRVATTPDGTVTSVGSMTGTVVDATTGAGVDGAIVSLVPDKSFNPEAEAIAGQTGGDGKFVIAAVHAGSYFVDVGRKGYKGVASKATIWAGRSNDGNRYKISPTSTVANCPKLLAGKPNPLCP